MITLKNIKELVNSFYKTDIDVKSRKIEFKEPRQIYCYLSRSVTKNYTHVFTHEAIAKGVKGFKPKHDNSIHAVKTIEGLIKFDKKLEKDVNFLIAKIKEINLSEDKEYKKYLILKQKYEEDIDNVITTK